MDSMDFKNDLYFFDMSTMRWEEVQGVVNSSIPGVWPQRRARHSLAKLSSRTAVLSGGAFVYDDDLEDYLGDSWILDIEQCISRENTKDIWTRCDHHEEQKTRRGHIAVQGRIL